ncbi:N-acetyl-D-glucosamine kinase [Serratia rubidaea]|nr:N-acetyl-D-glucosamine kinase [Serratia rubidaea]
MFYGFDMGGSKIELGVFDADLQRVWQKRVATPRDDYRQLLATLRDMTLEADAVCGAAGQVGIAFPVCLTMMTARCLPPTCRRRWGRRCRAIWRR